MRRARWFGRAASGVVVAAVVLTAAAFASSGANERVAKEGGTFRVAVPAGRFGTIDPALISGPELQLLEPACGNLMGYPSKPLPRGGRLAPELAEADPVVSRDGRTYTFRVRTDARFSDGVPVTARAFVRAIERILDPAMKGFVAPWFAAALVGGEDVLAGKAKTPRGVSAKGRVLTLRIKKRDPTFLELTEILCAVPPNLRADREGARAPLPSAAPYYVAEYVPGERLALERNRFYRGKRPHHVDRFVADLGADRSAIIDEIASGKFDCCVGLFGDRASELELRYGVNRAQFFVKPEYSLAMLVLNTSAPLFRNNPKLRQAVNFAIDRTALTRELGPLAGTRTDQFLSPSQPGYRDERIYPLNAPDLRRARKLAKGNLRSGQAVLYTRTNAVDVAQAQVLQQSMKAIGLEVEVVPFPSQDVLYDKLETDRRGFDIGRVQFGHSPDPSWFSDIFDGQTIGRSGNQNYSYFNSPTFNRLFDQASRLPVGSERDRAYGRLDVQLSRDAAPAIPFANLNAMTFVSARVGCIVLNPGLDLTAVCLK
ncbi:MAG: ABC transporter substrate-binding protein [Gaiellaceae bacterium]